MAAHARSVLNGSGLTAPVGADHLLLGSWQGIDLWAHRPEGQLRRIAVTVLGA